jgi:hypothetical protein
MPNALVTDGSEQNLQKSGAPLFNFWLNMRRYLLWRGLASQLNLIKKAGGLQDVGACNPAVKAAIDGIS